MAVDSLTDGSASADSADSMSSMSLDVNNELLSLPNYVQSMKQNDDVPSNDDDIDKLWALLSVMEKPQIDAKDEDGDTALHNATRRGLKRVAIKLFSVSADISLENNSGYQPLHVACSRGHLWFAKELFNRGADIEAKDKWEQTPLFLASWKGMKEVVEWLLEHNAETETFTSLGNSPLSVASQEGHFEIFKLLLRANPLLLNSAPGSLKWTPLHAAVYHDRLKIVDILLEAGARIDLCDNDGWTPLMTAICRTNEAATKRLLGHRPDGQDLQLETRDALGNTPLAKAAQKGFAAGIRLLINAGADCNGRDQQFKRPVLTIASYLRHTKSVQALLESGKITDGNILDMKGWSAIGLASGFGNTKVVELLLRHETLLSLSEEYKVQALVAGCLQGCESVVSLLLGPKGNVPIDAHLAGKTGLHYACHATTEDLRSIDPQWHGSDDLSEDERRDPAFLSGRYDSVVRLLLHRGAKPDARSDTQDTPLHFAAKGGDPTRLNIILEHVEHGEVSLMNSKGETALCVAFKGKKPERAMRTLLTSPKLKTAEFGKDDAKHDALLWAAGNSETHDIAKLLIVKGSMATKNYNAPPKSAQWSVIEWAIFYKLPQILWLLIASSPRSSPTEASLGHAMQLAVGEPRLLQNQTTDQSAEAVVETGPTQQEANDGEIQSQRGDRQILIDILQDLPIGLMCRDSETYDLPVFEDRHTNVLDNFQCTAVQFYQEQNQSSFIRRYRTVREMIYQSGPKAIMDKTIQGLRGIIGTSRSVPSMVHMDSRPSFTWVHLPAANIVWMNDLLQRIMKDGNYRTDDFRSVSSFLQESWGEIPDRTSPSRNMRPRIVLRGPSLEDNRDNTIRTTREERYVGRKEHIKASPEKEGDENGGVKQGADITGGDVPHKAADIKDSAKDKLREAAPDRADEKTQTFIPASAIYMPYLTFSAHYRDDASLEPVNNTNSEKERLEQLRKAKEKYIGLLQAYDGSVIHGSPTLDEWYYHFADDRESTKDKIYRNQTQVVSKSLEADISKLTHWPLLRVNQLWIWTIDNRWIITATSPQVDGDKDTLLEGILHHLTKQIEAQGSRSQPSSVFDMSKLIVYYCIGSYERQRKLDDQSNRPELQTSIRQIFSNAINIIGRNETTVFDEFSSKARKRRNQLYHRSGTESLADEEIKETIKNAETLYCDIKDIRDELSILKSIAQYQKTVQDGLMSGNTTAFNLTATYMANDLQEMDKVAVRIQAALNTTLSLQQSEVTNLQATLSVEQGQQAAKQGRTLMVFTVVTILFLPLSFLSSLFAMDVEAFQKSPRWALAIIFSVSLAFFIPLATYAIYSNEISDLIIGRKQKGSSIHDEEVVRRGTGLSAKGVLESTTPQAIGELKDGMNGINPGHNAERGSLRSRYPRWNRTDRGEREDAQPIIRALPTSLKIHDEEAGQA
ncbi:hypothetical protein ACHAPJ_011838 [Fusarium lateritium]